MRIRGFTVIELLVGITIFAILMLLALPTMQDFIHNTRIRNTADSIANGVRLAQVEAIRRNQPVEFILDADGWRVNDPNPGPFTGTVQSENFSDAKNQLTIAAQPPGALRLAFNAIGQYLNAPDPDISPLAAPDPIAFINITTAAIASPKDLRVVATGPVGIRVCDPDFTNLLDPKTGSIACP